MGVHSYCAGTLSTLPLPLIRPSQHQQCHCFCHHYEHPTSPLPSSQCRPASLPGLELDDLPGKPLSGVIEQLGPQVNPAGSPEAFPGVVLEGMVRQSSEFSVSAVKIMGSA